MAGNTQFQQDAFQMAETGIDVGIATRNLRDRRAYDTCRGSTPRATIASP